MKESNKKLALGALVGVMAGFITGILTAPKSGKETREDIKNTAGKVYREAEMKLKDLNSELGDLIEKGTKLAAAKGSTAKKEVDKVLSGAQDAKQKVKEVISALKSGETDEPELKQAIKEATKAKDHLAKYLKKN
jgi:gas vesicle protein